jgi:apolipoprotein N-acyltransferase
MRSLAHSVILASGWRRRLIAFGAGAAGALAMPPFGFLPAIMICLSVALWLIDRAAAENPTLGPRAIWSAATAGWWWGFGYFVAGLWWLGAAFLVEADLFAWALPFGVLGLPAVLACFFALGFALARLVWAPNASRIFALAAALTTSEWLRGHILTGFPWNTLGMALGQHVFLMQTASVVGLYGLTLLTVLVGAAPALFFSERTIWRRLAAPGLSLLALAALAAFGLWRVPGEAVKQVPGARLRLMQPNLPQDAAFGPDNRDEIMRRYLLLSATGSGSGLPRDITHLVWPESAFPFLLDRDASALAQLAALLSPGQALITGAARMEDPLPGEIVGRFFNAIQVVSHDGTVTGSYDKVHLVPFGEYLPSPVEALVRAIGLRQFVTMPGGFVPADSRRALSVGGLPPVAATICYEAIFPGEITGEGPRPDLILNVTNDAWFGATPGPYQHFAQARLRAVEEGLPLVRAANTGISAVVDPYGRVVDALPLGVAGILDSSLPVAIPPPIYRGLGSIILAVMVVVCLIPPLLACRRGSIRIADPAFARSSPRRTTVHEEVDQHG